MTLANKVFERLPGTAAGHRMLGISSSTPPKDPDVWGGGGDRLTVTQASAGDAGFKQTQLTVRKLEFPEPGFFHLMVSIANPL